MKFGEGDPHVLGDIPIKFQVDRSLDEEDIGQPRLTKLSQKAQSNG